MKSLNRAKIKHKFVEFIPSTLETGTLYVSLVYRTAQHLCICGCGERVVTPLTPNNWSLIFDGETVTLEPSIGNWNFECQSHYWIRKNRIIIARRWSEYEIQKERNEALKRNYKKQK